MKGRDLIVAGAFVAAAAAAVGVIALSFSNSSTATAKAAPVAPASPVTFATFPTPTPTVVSRPTYPLTGLPMSDADAAAKRQRPVAVMIDNNDAANPPVGLDRADLVFEAPVEGGITRYLAVYDSQQADIIEPVRSARTPFLAWVQEFDALYAHVGRAETPGPADSGKQIADLKIADLDMEGGPAPVPDAYRRDPDREAPHNVITSTGALRGAAALRGLNQPPRMGEWRFSTSAGADSSLPAATQIRLDFGPANDSNASWTWDAAAGVYSRSGRGGPLLDGATGQQITAVNVAVMHARAAVADADGHVLIENVGQGPAEVFLAGRMIKGTWRKTDSASRTRFYDSAGNEIAFRRGNTWIEVEGLSN